MVMLREIGSIDKVEAFMQDALANKKKIMGFGHRVYKSYDPREVPQDPRRATLEGHRQRRVVQMSKKIEDVMHAAVAAKGIYPNVDFYSATMYHSIGLKLDLFTPMFAMSRISGWAGHNLEQLSDNRLIRPKAAYVGPHGVKYVPLNERG